MKMTGWHWLGIGLGFVGAAVLSAHISKKEREENAPPAPDEPKEIEATRVNVITFPKKVRTL